MDKCSKCGTTQNVIHSQISVNNLRNGQRKIAVNHDLCGDCETKIYDQFVELANTTKASLAGDDEVDTGTENETSENAGAADESGENIDENPDEDADADEDEDETVSAENVVDVLDLADIEVDLETVQGWNAQQLQEAHDYATAVIDHVDDANVVIPDVPEFLKA